MSTQLDLVPVKPTTAIVGEAGHAKVRPAPCGSGCWSTTASPPCAAVVLGAGAPHRAVRPDADRRPRHRASTWTTPTRRRSPWPTAGPTCSAPTRWAAACWPGSIVASRTTLSVAIPAVVISAVIGSLIGMWAGFYRGWRETVAMRVADVIMSFPSLLLAVVVLYVFSPSAANIVAGAGHHPHPGLPAHRPRRVGRAAEPLFVDAARTFGASGTSIITRHVLPIVLPTLLTVATLDFCYVMLAESSLSFLGIGIQPPDVSWGLMVAQGRTYLHTAWWLSFFPGLAIVITTVSATILAAWARIATDPGQRWRLTVPQKRLSRFAKTAKGTLR